MPGFVYIMTNPHMPGLVKIGRTARHPAERQATLSRSTSVPANFTIEGFVFVQDERAAEVKLHAVFADARTQRGEFFKISIASALQALSLFGRVYRLKPAPIDPPVKMPASWILALFALAGITISATIADGLRYFEPWSMIVSTVSSTILGLAIADAIVRFELLSKMSSALREFAFRWPIAGLPRSIRQQFFDERR